MKQRKGFLFNVFTMLMFIAGGLLFSADLNAKPLVEWSPVKLTVEQMQGTQSINVVRAQVAKDVQGLVVRVIPELQQWISVSPSTIGALQSGQVIDITVAINLPVDAGIGKYHGVIQLRHSVAGEPQKVLAKPLPVVLDITQLVDDGLPPDPGDAGKQTLLGFDMDHDGVRDDIQRYIYFTYIDDKKVKAALTEVAKQYQALLSNANDPDAVFENATKMARHGECLDFIVGEDAADILVSLRAEVLNTRERSIGYITYSDTLGGEIILGRPFTEWKNSCAFDVDAIGVSQ
jgi:hypothetical protein